MSKPMLGLVLCLTAGSAFGEANCDTKASAKKLAGAAKNSFLQKCERKDTCAGHATEKKLRGAAKTSFIKKCINDAKSAGK